MTKGHITLKRSIIKILLTNINLCKEYTYKPVIDMVDSQERLIEEFMSHGKRYTRNWFFKLSQTLQETNGKERLEEGCAIGIDDKGNVLYFYVVDGDLDCSNKKLVSLEVPHGVKTLDCSNNNLTSLEVPQGVKDLDCSNNNLTSLVVPQGVTHLYCHNNSLTSLEVPQGVTHLYCSYSNLTSLVVPQGVTHLYCNNNKLVSLEVPQGVEVLDCDDSIPTTKRTT